MSLLPPIKNAIVGPIPKTAATMNATMVYAGYPCGRVRLCAQPLRGSFSFNKCSGAGPLAARGGAPHTPWCVHNAVFGISPVN